MTNSQENTLQFGTGGIRGIMGPRTTQMNEDTVKKVVQGLCTYLHSLHLASKIKVVIAHDTRINSKEFAQIAARVLASNTIEAFIFDSAETTPLLSFTVRYLNGVAGICITASHNPPQYNGIKVYWSNGAQIVPPIDQELVKTIHAVNIYPNIVTFKDAQRKGLIHFVEDIVKQAYFDNIKQTLRSYFSFINLEKHEKTLSIVYTPLHGTGYEPATYLLKSLNFNNVFVVPEQKEPDGTFPTVKKPNPEEPEALHLALKYAHKQNADIIFATDPDSDRLAVCVKDKTHAKGIYKSQSSGDYVLLNGNQTGVLLLYFILEQLKTANRLDSDYKVVKTMVSSRLFEILANSYKIECFSTPTGFKWIAMLIDQWEKQGSSNKFLFGAEESFGYMFSNNVRDKDAICTIGCAAEMANFFLDKGKSLCDILIEIFGKFGAWQESLINIECEPTPKGMEKISTIMKKFRENPPENFCGISVKSSIDYLNIREAHPFPQSDVLQYTLEDNSQISVRPSGTEPKLKIYLSVCSKSSNTDEAIKQTHDKIQTLRYELLKQIN